MVKLLVRLDFCRIPGSGLIVSVLGSGSSSGLIVFCSLAQHFTLTVTVGLDVLLAKVTRYITGMG